MFGICAVAITRQRDVLLKEAGMLFTRNGASLADAIQKAIDDHRITTSEYDEIIHLAHNDNVIDAHEKVLLRELNLMIADGLIKRVP